MGFPIDYNGESHTCTQFFSETKMAVFCFDGFKMGISLKEGNTFYWPLASCLSQLLGLNWPNTLLHDGSLNLQDISHWPPMVSANSPCHPIIYFKTYCFEWSMNLLFWTVSELTALNDQWTNCEYTALNGQWTYCFEWSMNQLFWMVSEPTVLNGQWTNCFEWSVNQLFWMVIEPTVLNGQWTNCFEWSVNQLFWMFCEPTVLNGHWTYCFEWSVNLWFSTHS